LNATTTGLVIRRVWSSTYFTLCGFDDGPLEISITSIHDLHEFIEAFNLRTFKDIDNLGYNHLWVHYLNGGAEIIVAPIELEANLHFKIIRFKTIVFSLDLHFYDEVYEHLTIPEDFERYIDEHEQMLSAAVANRYKFGRG
jgi:hypothetical protein